MRAIDCGSSDLPLNTSIVDSGDIAIFQLPKKHPFELPPMQRSPLSFRKRHTASLDVGQPQEIVVARRLTADEADSIERCSDTLTGQ
jgi:hypothetical protein